ncbi:unnamed protein product [Arabidopsis halleri]
MVVLKGGLSSGYKNRMTEKGSSDGISCTYSSIRKISAIFNQLSRCVHRLKRFTTFDLLTEEMHLCGLVNVWTQRKNKYNVSRLTNFVQRYIDLAVSLNALSPKVPLYEITEGNEPCFFTIYFSWDSTKATDQASNGNQGPRQRAAALAALTSGFNTPSGRTSSPDQSSSGNQGPRQRAAALAALTSAFNSSSGKTSSPIWKMDLEARSLQPSAKAMAEAFLRLTLLSSFRVSADQRGRLAWSVKRLDQSRDRLREIRRLLLETEEVGISVFQDLKQQCQTLHHVHTKVVKIDGRVIGDRKVGRVTRTLQNAYKKDRGFWCANAYLPRTLKYKTRGFIPFILGFEHEGT